jgi:hypothetical protein
MAACWPIDIPSTQKFVLISLADNANDNGICWPSIPTICRRTSLHRATVLRAIAWLTEHGYLAVNRETGRHNSYRIAVGSFPQPVAERDGSQSATSRTERPHPSQKATTPVAQSDPNRNEPSRTVTHTRARARGGGNGSAGRNQDAWEHYKRLDAEMDAEAVCQVAGTIREPLELPVAHRRNARGRH